MDTIITKPETGRIARCPQCEGIMRKEDKIMRCEKCGYHVPANWDKQDDGE